MVNEMNFIVHFTLHRNEKTVGEVKKFLIDENTLSFHLFSLLYQWIDRKSTSEFKEIEETLSIIQNIEIESRMVISGIPIECSVFTRYIHRLNCIERWTFSLIIDFVMRVWITSFNQCRLFLQYDIHLDDSLVPDEQVMNFDDSSKWSCLFLLERKSNERK